jgi:hypothetical protein
MVTARINLDDVRSALHIADVADYYGLGRPGLAKRRLPSCPRCGADSSSKAIVINTVRNTWGHFGHGKEEGGDCYGDAIDLVAACEGLDTRRDFAAVLKRAAEIAGVDPDLTDAQRVVQRAERERQEADRQRQADREEATMVREAKLKASATWQRLARSRHNRAGKAYLQAVRELKAEALVEADHVRFDLLGNVCVPLYAPDDSELVNVVSRIISETNTGPKVLDLAGCPTSGTLCGRVLDIEAGSTVVIAEGVIDTLTAIRLWPDAVVLGAHGAGRMTSIVETVAPIVKTKAGKLVLVPDGDDVGQRCAIKAGEAALSAGLVMDETLIVIDLGVHHDLNAAHCAGWRPS